MSKKCALPASFNWWDNLVLRVCLLFGRPLRRFFCFLRELSLRDRLLLQRSLVGVGFYVPSAVLPLSCRLLPHSVR